MLMRRLREFAFQDPDLQRDLQNPMFEHAPVRWVIQIDRSGRFLGLTERKGEKNRPLEGEIPKTGRRNRSKQANLAVDTANYVVGPCENIAKQNKEKAKISHESFKKLLKEAATATGDPGLQACAGFYDDPGNLDALCKALAGQKATEGDRFAFALSGEAGWVCQRSAARQFWGVYRTQEIGRVSGRVKGGTDLTRCLCCGEAKQIADRHRTPIKGVPGGQQTGTSLISFDKDAFCSYGWEFSFNCPVCVDCAEVYTRALNKLLRRDNSPRTRLDESGVAILYWTIGGEAFPLADLFERPDPRAVEELMLAARTGRMPATIEPSAFCVLAVSGAGGRVMVRQWLDMTVQQAQRNLAQWFDDLAIVAYIDQKDDRGNVLVERGKRALPPSLNLIVRGLASEGKDVSRQQHLVPDLLRAALAGGPLPQAALALALERLAAEIGNRDLGGPRIGPARMGLIRATLNRMERIYGGGSRPMAEQLDPQQESPGYLCGRLLALLEGVQYQAVGDVGADIVDRFYGRAAASPVSAFPILMRLAQSHLRTLRRDKPGLAVMFDRQISEICQRLGRDFPVSLTLPEQGRFALGYYHQRAAGFARGAEKEVAAEEIATA
jgi:CRISPR-associated protein Csd1